MQPLPGTSQVLLLARIRQAFAREGPTLTGKSDWLATVYLQGRSANRRIEQARNKLGQFSAPSISQFPKKKFSSPEQALLFLCGGGSFRCASSLRGYGCGQSDADRRLPLHSCAHYFFRRLWAS